MTDRARPESAAAPDQLAELLRQVRRIELRTERLVNALTAGRYRSAFRGQGMEFDEVREYAAGDDVRHIDWNVTARAGRPYVKVFREERELTILLLVDVSGSMRFGAIPGISQRTKLALAAEAAAVVAVNAFKNHDKVGLTLFSDRSDLHLAPKKGRGHALRLVREVLAASGSTRGTALSDALDSLELTARRRCVVFVASDFLADDPGFVRALARAARRHDLVGLRIADPAEAALPAAGAPLRLSDPEGGGEVVISSSAANRRAYAEAYAARREQVKGAFRASGGDLVELATDKPAFAALSAFFRQRRRG